MLECPSQIAIVEISTPDVKRFMATECRKWGAPHFCHTTATHMLESGVPLVAVKNFLGHVSLQTTQIYIEITQDTMNRQLKSWNDKWFPKDESDKNNGKEKSNIPDFLK